MRLILIFIVVLLFVQTCFAQDETVYDTLKIQARTFNEKNMATFKADKAFQYDRFKESPKTIFDRIMDWIVDKILRQLFGSKIGSASLQTILLLLSIIVIVFFVLKLTGMTKAGLFGRKDGKELDYTTVDEDIHSINFETAIQQAVDSGNLRLAVRLLYLQSLKKLADIDLIKWQINKTNIAYVQELTGSQYQQPFNNLTLQFESNWYGDRAIDEGEFKAVREQFNQFNSLLA